ncbi:MAG TPA: type II secretion system secretin GspD [Candidatus Binataceae bacterium]|nr:type II secretion system secretin GspD [Candidatus Binataceae bacterium]
MGGFWTRAFAAGLCLTCFAAAISAADEVPSGTSAAVDTAAADTSPPGVAADSAGFPAGEQRITMNFQNVDIPVLVKFISQITGRNFVLDESVRGRVTVISPTPVTPEQAYRTFLSVLQLKGLTTVQAGSVIKIVPARTVRDSAMLTQSQEPAAPYGDQYVTRLVKLRNIDAASIMSVIQPMVSHDGMIADYPQDNTLIITDDAYNVQRLLRIIGSLDVPNVQETVKVIPLKLAFADDLASQIQKIMTARESAAHGASMMPRFGPRPETPSSTFSIVPDERTNSLIVLASQLEMRQIADLISKLDIRAPYQDERIHVYPLKYAAASEMLDTLSGLLGGGGGPSTLSPSTGKNSLGRGSSLGTMNGSSFGMGSNSSGSTFGSTGSSMTGFGGGSSIGSSTMGSSMGGMGMGSSGLSSRSNSSSSSGTTTASTGSGPTPDFTGAVNVTADLATNSLVVSAAPQDWETLKRVIDQLDVPRVQVFVQAIIVEVDVNRTKDIGVNFYTSNGLGGNLLGVGTLNTGQLASYLGDPLGISGLGIGLASGSNCTIPSSSSSSSTTSTSTVTVPCDLALMTALESDTHSNVLSAPTLLTADNEEAMIVVGENLPFVGSASANSGLPGQIFNSVDRQNVGITLDIVPQVSEGEYVRLDLYEEVSNVVPGTANNSLGPTTTIRSASTSVLVQNHRTAVVGGLISSDAENARTGVPFLSDIPVLGNLFSDNSREMTKQNLLVFLTPHIIRTREDLQALALDQRQKYVRALGRTEVNNMPPSQFEQMYQPTFNRAVSPQEDLQQYQSPAGPMPGTSPLSAPPSYPSTSSTYPSSSSATAPGIGGASPFSSTSVPPSAASGSSLPPTATTTSP